MIFPHMSLHCMLVPVQYLEYEYGLLSEKITVVIKLSRTSNFIGSC